MKKGWMFPFSLGLVCILAGVGLSSCSSVNDIQGVTPQFFRKFENFPQIFSGFSELFASLSPQQKGEGSYGTS
jgi:hypothetical protein